ncbi:putative RNA recognition motif domain, nucleotide-binding alpha-beta plait domain superfamily [Helianthus debilis subsp. tardiflorus]
MLGVNRFPRSRLFRWMALRHSSSKLFVGGLSYDTNEPVLKEVFGQHGEIIEAKVICDHKSGKSKGYGFVHFISKDSASKALAEMDGQVLDGRNIRIQYANMKEGCCNLNLERELSRQMTKGKDEGDEAKPRP